MPLPVFNIAMAICLVALFCAPQWTIAQQDSEPVVYRSTIAFGSCLRQWQDQAVWQAISRLSPQAFVFLGDNVYSDVGKYVDEAEPARIKRAYDDLSGTQEFQSFLIAAKRNGTSLYATWDDHDYGVNDGGEDFPYKLESKQYFLDFFDLENTASGDATHPGIYQSHHLNLEGLDVQLILLDTRSFRTPLKKDPDSEICPRTRTVPDKNPEATVLGEQQWQWLQQELALPAELRIIASSIQVIPEQHCFEKWANFPLERKHLFDVIKKTRAEGVILISGDRHLAEISKLPDTVVGYPVYEITASGLNSAMGIKAAIFGEENRYRIGDVEFENNFGAISVQKTDGKILLTLGIYQDNGAATRQVVLDLDNLSFR